jgi:drug/metabolite transporter (DMT)-like permease
MTALLALASSLLWGSADFLGGTLSRRVHPFAVVGSSQTVGLIGVLLVALPLGAAADPGGYLPWAVAAGALGMVSLVVFYSALAIGTMGIVAPVAATGVIVPVLAGLAAGERPTGLQLAGIVLAIAGVVLASGPELRAAEGVRVPGGARALVLALISAVGFGLVLWFLSKGSQYSVGMTLVVQRVTAVSLIALAALGIRRLGGLTPRDLPIVAAAGIGDVLANGLYALATQSGLLSLVSVLGSLYPVMTVLLARLFHGERLQRVQNVGVVASLLGVVLIGTGGV